MEDNQHPTQPVVVYPDPEASVGWDETAFGSVRWWTLLSADQTPTNTMTCGITEIGPRQATTPMIHKHTQAEIYHILSGEGVVTIDGREYPVSQGATVFIPGSLAHGVANTGSEPLRFFYVFAVDALADITYEAAGDT